MGDDKDVLEHIDPANLAHLQRDIELLEARVARRVLKLVAAVVGALAAVAGLGGVLSWNTLVSQAKDAAVAQLASEKAKQEVLDRAKSQLQDAVQGVQQEAQYTKDRIKAEDITCVKSLSGAVQDALNKLDAIEHRQHRANQ
jgi:hypothetical protein